MLKKIKQKETKWITNETPSTLQVMIKVEGEPTKSFIFHTSNKAINKIRKAIEARNLSQFLSAQDVYASVKKDPNFNFKEDERALYFNGAEVPEVLAKKIFTFHQEGLDTTPLVKFAERLSLNPSQQSAQRLYGCLRVNHHPILPDGRFLAYKRVGPNFMDLYSGTIDNSVGTKPTVSRSQVDDNNHQTCSKGLHVASFEYAAESYCNSPENPLLIVAVDPADVVAVPRDYNQQKMRVCSYEVLRVCEDMEEIRSELVNDYGFETTNPPTMKMESHEEGDDDSDQDCYVADTEEDSEDESEDADACDEFDDSEDDQSDEQDDAETEVDRLAEELNEDFYLVFSQWASPVQIQQAREKLLAHYPQVKELASEDPDFYYLQARYGLSFDGAGAEITYGRIVMAAQGGSELAKKYLKSVCD